MAMKELQLQKDRAYRERNQLVAFLSHLLPAWLSVHEENDKDWDSEWMWIVYMEVPVLNPRDHEDFWPSSNFEQIEKPKDPVKQISWHIHESELPLFDHLPIRPHSWDGHSNDEKYHRMRNADFKLLGKIIKDITNERSRI